MKIHYLNFHQEFNTPVKQLWEAFNDHANFGQIMGQNIERVVDSHDTSNVNGIGSIRRINIPLLPFEETIQKSVKPTLIEYKITKGTPLSHHYGRMNFKSLSDTTSALDYTIEIGSNIPLLGTVVAYGLEKGIAAGLKKLARDLAHK